MSTSEKNQALASDDKIEFDELLIKAIKNRPVLYEKNRSKDSANKASAWLEVAKETGKIEQDCKVRWRSLRDRFVREKKANAHSDDGHPGVKEKSALMEQLEFLSTCISHRSLNKSPRSGPPSLSPLSILETAIKFDDSDDQSSMDTYDESIVINEQAKRLRPDSSPSPPCLLNGDSNPTKKPRMNGHTTPSRKDLPSYRPYFDEDELFCRSLVGPLKRLPYYKRFLAKTKMLQNIFELQFDQPMPH